MRARAGSNAVEFGLLAPLLFAMLFAGLEGAWLVAHERSLSAAVTEGAHRAAVTSRTQDSVAVAKEAARAKWATQGLRGEPDFSAAYEGSTIVVEGVLEHGSITGVWGPYTTLSSRTRAYLEP